MAGIKSKSSKVGRSGPSLLREVYAELYAVLGQIYSPREILIAAQKIIDINALEYFDQQYQESPHYSTDYSKAVDLMIRYHPWKVFRIEQRCDDLADERFSADEFARMDLKKYYNPDKYLHRG